MSARVSDIQPTVQWLFETACDILLSSFRSWDALAQALGQIPNVFTNFASSLAWPYLLSSLVLAWGAYALEKRRGAVSTFKDFAFPSWLYGHPSTLLDGRFMAVDLVISFLLYVPIYTALSLLSTKVLSRLLVDRAGWEPPHEMTPLMIVLTSALFVLLLDFVTYWGHRWMHRSVLLWSFHQVHHSAEVLTPAAGFRVHPMENVFVVALRAPLLGLTVVTFQNVAGADREFFMIGGITVMSFVLQALGGHLKHSHIWLSFGRFNSVLISPAHHQLHHSVDPRHWNKNFGEKLAVWDRLFGTLCVPKAPEAVAVGLPDAVPGIFRTVADLYLAPWRRTMKIYEAPQQTVSQSARG